MFKKVEPLDKNKHIDVKFTPAENYGFAGDVSIAPLSYTELPRASKYYPVVFSATDIPMPQALLSLKQGQNAFLDDAGRWRVPYIPIHIRRYPFILAKAGDEGNFAVCIDREAPHFSREQGDPLYTANGEPTDILNKAVSFLQRYHQEIQDTEKLCAPLQEQGLFVDRQLTIGQGDQQKTLRGFRTVDTETLGGLDTETLGTWVKQGVMGLVYAHVHSLDTLQGLAG